MKAIHTFVCAAGLAGLALLSSSSSVQGGEEPPPPGALHGKFITETRVKTRGATSDKDLVLYLTPKQDVEVDASKAKIEVVQEKLQFAPHVVACQVGSTLVFQNKDSVTHNVFADDDCCGADIDMEAGQETELQLDKAGDVAIICRLHPGMELYIKVLPYPWFTQTTIEKIKDGDKKTYEANFRIDDVPPGDYVLRFWNKSLELREFDVTIESGKELEFDIVD